MQEAINTLPVTWRLYAKYQPVWFLAVTTILCGYGYGQTTPIEHNNTLLGHMEIICQISALLVIDNKKQQLPVGVADGETPSCEDSDTINHKESMGGWRGMAINITSTWLRKDVFFFMFDLLTDIVLMISSNIGKHIF